jgi:diacylglycerol O-acyltransferase / wax synthase
MDRMSTLDAEFLHLEDHASHMHIAGVCTFAGDPPRLEELRDLVASKLHLIPRYRQRVQPVPLDLGRPVWVDDQHFHLDYHLRHTALPAPGDDAELHRLMGRLMSQPLDLDRPLWEAWLVEGLSEDRWALVFKLHHCMVDGIAGVGLLTVLLDLEPDASRPEPEPWEPAPSPSAPALVLDAWSGLAADTWSLLGRVPDALRDPRGTLRHAGQLSQGMVRMLRHLTMTGHSSIEGGIGPHRVWSHSSVPFAHVRDIRQTLGGTVNDVVLAAVSGGYRELLQHRGDDPATTEVRSLVPVSVRGADADGVPDNRVSALFLDLPVDLADPVQRLVEVQRRMGALKGSHIAEAAELVTHVGDLAPPTVVAAVTRAGLRTQHLMTQRSITTVTTNVPGPQFPLYCLGREMLEYLPYVPISHGVRVGTAILSYNGRLAFGVTGDLDHAADIDVLARGIVRGITDLRDAAGDAAEHLVEGARE